MEATALEDSAAMMLPHQDAKKKSVGSCKEIPFFAEEPKVVYLVDQKDNTYIAEDTCSCCASRSQSDNDSSDCPFSSCGIFYSSTSTSCGSTSTATSTNWHISSIGTSLDSFHTMSDDSVLHVDPALACTSNEVQDKHGQLEPATLFNAGLSYR